VGARPGPVAVRMVAPRQRPRCALPALVIAAEPSSAHGSPQFQEPSRVLEPSQGKATSGTWFRCSAWPAACTSGAARPLVSSWKSGSVPSLSAGPAPAGPGHTAPAPLGAGDGGPPSGRGAVYSRAGVRICWNRPRSSASAAACRSVAYLAAGQLQPRARRGAAVGHAHAHAVLPLPLSNAGRSRSRPGRAWSGRRRARTRSGRRQAGRQPAVASRAPSGGSHQVPLRGCQCRVHPLWAALLQPADAALQRQGMASPRASAPAPHTPAPTLPPPPDSRAPDSAPRLPRPRLPRPDSRAPDSRASDLMPYRPSRSTRHPPPPPAPARGPARCPWCRRVCIALLWLLVPAGVDSYVWMPRPCTWNEMTRHPRLIDLLQRGECGGRPFSVCAPRRGETRTGRDQRRLTETWLQVLFGQWCIRVRATHPGT